MPMALLPAACTTAAIEDVAPVAAESAAEAGRPSFARPGDYPNLNVVPTPAATQFTEEEKAERIETLRARRDNLVGQSRGVRDRSAELRRLGRSHADDALRAIEAEGG